MGSAALVGSSNFTSPGLEQNVELNVQLRQDVEKLQDWFEQHWEDAEDVSEEILQVIVRHTRQYSPFEIYVRSMEAFFRGRKLEAEEWELTDSRMHEVLDQYQREGYHNLLKIARRYSGALLCDGVGLGKTFIGLMLIERLLFERKKIALLVPKAGREDVWMKTFRKFLPKAGGRFTDLVVYNHTDLLRDAPYPELMQEIKEEADAIVIDEAHHFRNTSSKRQRKLYEIAEGKEIYLLTATPINNSLYDLLHLIEIFSRDRADYFRDAPLGIHTLRGHFRKMEKALDAIVLSENEKPIEINIPEAEKILSDDDLFQTLVVQRSRAYVRRSLDQQGEIKVLFPERQDPKVAEYSLVRTYGGLLDSFVKAFDKKDPVITLPIYTPLAYQILKQGDPDPLEAGRQNQVVGLIRTLLLKRYESSYKAFEASCEDILLKLLHFIRLHNPKTASTWEKKNAHLLEQIQKHLASRGLREIDEEDWEEDIVPEEFKKKIVKLEETEYQVSAMVIDSLKDMDQLAEFLNEIKEFDPAKDDKLQVLLKLLKTDPYLRNHKVLLFTEYQDTARYLARELKGAGIGPMEQIDGQRGDVSRTVRAFSPYYNESSSRKLDDEGLEQIRVLVSTDILAEGLNLQDAACVINYDLHWNPVRLMQRIGRVDRRLNLETESQMVRDHPELEEIRGKVFLWNFLPPDELKAILSLYKRVTHKTLRISKVFGIEGKKLLTPEDDWQALRDFNEAYEGTTSDFEEMYLAYQQLEKDYPEMVGQAPGLPLKVFSGKAHSSEGARGVFFCYRLPVLDAEKVEVDEEASLTKWYIYDLESEAITDKAPEIFRFIQSEPNTPRFSVVNKPTLAEIRRKMDKHITNSYMKKSQMPVDAEAILLAWMELS